MAAKGKGDSRSDILATNRAAAHEYHLLRRYEAGIVLTGAEVKSARDGRVQLKEAYARIRDGEVFLHQAHFSPYVHGAAATQDPVRVRKLLLHAAEIRRLAKETEAAGATIVPTKLYLKGGRVKVEIAVARGKKQYDKRETLRKRDSEREIERSRQER